MDTIIDLFERSCLKFPDNPYLWEKKDGKYEALTYSWAKSRVMEIAAGLLAVGLKKGQRVALLSEGCSDWVCSELGILYAGGVNVPLSIRLTARELVFRINHSGARFVFVSPFYLHILNSILGELESVEKIVVFRSSGEMTGLCSPFARLVQEGRRWLGVHPGHLEEIACSVKSTDMANISYTSGTTAEPKGIILTHGNYVCNVLQADSLIRIPEFYKVLLFLPWDHSFAHTVGIYSFMYNGASLAAVDFGNSPMDFLRNIPLNMREIKPHVLLSVPAIAKNFRKNIEAEIQRKGRFVTFLYMRGLKFAYWYYGDGNYRKKGLKVLVAPVKHFFDSLVFSRIRKSFGGNLRFFIGGGALLDVELQKYYRALGIPMYQGYGLSEASPVISSNTPECHKFGSSGRPVTPMELRICDADGGIMPLGEQGEIVIRGGNVMRGYWCNEISTAETIREGWLYTGDLGFLDEHGFLTVLGRFKSLLIANDGEKYSPEGIEEALVEHSSCIDQLILYNNQSPYTTALLVPNKERLRKHLAHQNLDLTSDQGREEAIRIIQRQIDRFRKGGDLSSMFPDRWLPTTFAILPEPFTEQNGMVNSTMKIVRGKVEKAYAARIAQLYTPEGKNPQNKWNKEAL